MQRTDVRGWSGRVPPRPEQCLEPPPGSSDRLSDSNISSDSLEDAVGGFGTIVEVWL